MSPAARGRRVAARDGFLFSLILDDRFLRYSLFGFIPLGWVRLKKVQYVRQRGGGELSDLVWEGIRKPFWHWYWPRPGLRRGAHHSAPFMICSESGRRIFVRLRPGFHHRLRMAVGSARSADPG